MFKFNKKGSDSQSESEKLLIESVELLTKVKDHLRLRGMVLSAGITVEVGDFLKRFEMDKKKADVE